MHKKFILIAVITVLALGGAYVVLERGVSPAASYKIEMVDGERIRDWDFQGVYTGDAVLEAQAKTEIERLEGLVGGGEHPDYIVFISLANQYELIGDGKNALAYLEKALGIDATETGLAWNNAGVLFARLGATSTARRAYERAFEAQPIEQYRTALVSFLKLYYPDDVEAVRAAETAGGVAEFPQ
jgi:tetratricopeptide (TPR) repeat protein